MSVPGDPPQPRRVLGDPLGTFGRVIAATAGAGVFLYLIGVGVLWQRMAREGLQQQEVIAAMPRDQLAVAGAREALVSAVSAAMFGLILYALLRAFRSSQRATATSGLRGWIACQMRDRPAALVTVLIAITATLIGPLSAAGAGFLVLFLATVFVGIRSAHRSLIGESQDFGASPLPWLRVALGLSTAVFIVSVARQSEFPDRFATATVIPKQGCALRGLYLGATSDGVALGRVARVEGCGNGRQANTLIIAGDEIRRVSLRDGPLPRRPSKSILHRLGLGAAFECIFPVCQVGGGRHGLFDLFVAELRRAKDEP